MMTKNVNKHVIRIPPPATRIAAPRLAKGTKDLPAQLRPDPRGCVVEHQLGIMWHYSLQMEQLGRNLATAGGLELAYRMGSLVRA